MDSVFTDKMTFPQGGIWLDGATYHVIQREFLKLRNPDAHLTDVLEDRDGSLLVVDTGGWFRIGCPSSLVAGPGLPPMRGCATRFAGARHRCSRPERRPILASVAKPETALPHRSTRAGAPLQRSEPQKSRSPTRGGTRPGRNAAQDGSHCRSSRFF